MTCLPDVNVWIALIVAEHVGHRSAAAWYGGSDWDTLAFSRVTQMGFLRLLTNQHRQNPNIAFVREPPGIEEGWRGLTTNGTVGHNFWTDAYLAAFAEAAGFTLVTFDRGFTKYKNMPIRVLSTRS
jgi:uncharacterized protein